MIKRLAAAAAMMVGLSITMLGFVVAPATAQSVVAASTPYGTQGTTSTTDPCRSGSSTGATSPACSSSSQPAVTTEASETASSGTQASSGGLAFTGTDVIGTVVLAFALIGGGIVMVRFSRRRRSA